MLIIEKPGLQTSVQDLGRPGFQQYGVVAGGVMDPYSHRIANLLVGNSEHCATIEAALAGPSIRFETDSLIALAGGDLSPGIDGEQIPMWRPVAVRAGAVLTFGKPVSGCRVYLAVAGGIDVPEVMGSRSTYTKARIGGFDGRCLEKGDRLLVGNPSVSSKQWSATVLSGAGNRKFCPADWAIQDSLIPAYGNEAEIRMMKGPQYHWFDEESRSAFFGRNFTVSSESDRMGYRLKGETLRLSEPRELLSEGVVAGSVQVPSGGSPILLMSDRQTTGGYPKIGQVATVDLPLIAQLQPGAKLRFREVSVEESQRLIVAQKRQLSELKSAVALKMKGE
ncbi:biotin-dependent carboxyltransferase family protein [Bhargavaea ginsengi]|uniref:5-oxoprolinase subunit C family protein n=1 Tax=Bhargavaea ginsengi TaxID=426757 RepID=UPI002041D506|nr:biotin-dependent carboxyltransferase family protein [Bhargavaea ginsengi]MCM3088451.1 biotin-dependent carboxyltransferase family protein [Bhargavaea ginsengi]